MTRRFLIALVLVAAACGDGATPAGAKGDITVFAAASLTETFTKIGTAFEAAHPGTHVRFNFGPSDGLANGIKESGGADVFASASGATMDLIVGSPGITERAVFARNRPVLIAPKDNPANIRTLADIVRPGVKVALAAPGVPIGKYARQILDNARLSGALKGASDEIDVKGVVQKALLGEADVGIVYTTDVTASVAPSVRTIEIPDAVNVIASYPIAVVAGTKHAALASAFVAYVMGKGRAVLRAAGFLAPA